MGRGSAIRTRPTGDFGAPLRTTADCNLQRAACVINRSDFNMVNSGRTSLEESSCRGTTSNGHSGNISAAWAVQCRASGGRRTDPDARLPPCWPHHMTIPPSAASPKAALDLRPLHDAVRPSGNVLSFRRRMRNGRKTHAPASERSILRRPRPRRDRTPDATRGSIGLAGLHRGPHAPAAGTSPPRSPPVQRADAE